MKCQVITTLASPQKNKIKNVRAPIMLKNENKQINENKRTFFSLQVQNTTMRRAHDLVPCLGGSHRKEK